jgi:hypothetical protein
MQVEDLYRPAKDRNQILRVTDGGKDTSCYIRLGRRSYRRPKAGADAVLR